MVTFGKFNILIFFLLFASVAKRCNAQERLISRFTYFSDDSQCSQYPKLSWENKFTTANRAVLNYTTDEHKYYQYTPSFKGLSGNAEVFIYKYSGSKNFDKHVLVEVGHDNKVDSLYVDFTSTRDAWISIGKFTFKGDGKDFVKFTRQTKSNSKIVTPIMPIRFDLYYNTKTRPLTTEESSLILPIGLSKKGNWQPFKKSGYRSQFTTFISTTKGDIARWNPGMAMEGKLNIYLYKPNIQSKDEYTIAHNGKIDKLYLSDLMFANLDLFNPINTQGWYKFGEFDFGGKGNEYIQLQKMTNDSTVLDCVMLEQVNLDGTLLDRTIVTPAQFNGKFEIESKTMSLEKKIKLTKKTVGLSPNNNGHTIVTSSKNGSTIYSRAIYSKEKSPYFIWNPCITEAGDYDLYYFVYFIPNNNGSFEINANGEKKVTPILISKLTAQQQYLVGTYKFKGDKADEFIEMKNLNRASDITLEKKKANGAVLQQVVVTAHPYFAEYTFTDTKDLTKNQHHNVSEMVRKKFIKPLNDDLFGINQPMTVKEFGQVLQLLLDSADVKYTDVAIYHQLDIKKYDERNITLFEAAQFMLNAMEISGRYTNVRNYFKTPSQQVLSKFSNVANYKNIEAIAKMLEIQVIKFEAKSTLAINKKLTRLEATLLLKEFNEQVLCSGPPAKADWDISFVDEFEGNNLDWNKWLADDAVRFKNISAKWKENCVVEDGLFKGYNYMDNHAVPYSSGNVHSNFRQTYGFFEARYKYPDKAYGSHSSFWTSSKGGDFNYNEGAYPNSVSNNNYFMKSGDNFHDFATPTNLAHDFHTFSGYLNSKDLFYGMDGKITWEVKDYPNFYPIVADKDSLLRRSTNFPYNAMMSTVVTYFDGPLDRDRIDGSYMACDWVRVYKEITWFPAVDTLFAINRNEASSLKSIDWVVKFNKPMDTETVKAAITIKSSNQTQLPEFVITPINALRYKITLANQLNSKTEYTLLISKNAKDTRGKPLSTAFKHTFKN